jgi:hypothetical protein
VLRGITAAVERVQPAAGGCYIVPRGRAGRGGC